jgi:hypothetical protein
LPKEKKMINYYGSTAKITPKKKAAEMIEVMLENLCDWQEEYRSLAHIMTQEEQDKVTEEIFKFQARIKKMIDRGQK